MRRIQTFDHHEIGYEVSLADVVIVSKRDLRLMRAVVKAVEKWSYNDGTCEVAELIKAIEVFDAKPRSKP